MLPPKVHTYLAEHHQLVTRARLCTMGFSSKRIEGWLRAGHLRQVHRGVYEPPTAPASLTRSVAAAVLRAGDRARAGGFASLALYGIEGFTVLDRADVVVAPGRKVKGEDGFDVKGTAVPRADCARHEDIAVLSAARALIEVAPLVDARRLRVAFDDALRRGLVTKAHMERRVRALPHLRGSKIFRRMLAEGTLDPATEGERGMQAFLTSVLPAEKIEWGVEDLVPGRCLDAAVRRLLLGFEYDSRAYHVLPLDRDNDGLRDLECEAAGVRIVRLTIGMIRDHPERTRARLLALVERRKRDLGLR
jgi:hypothetical protein